MSKGVEHMAFEEMTYDFLLDRMLTRISNMYPNLDTREGSMIYNALASAAVETAISYYELENVRRESFVPTASREFILIGCLQMGININQFKPTYGTFQAEFNVEVQAGSRWSCDLYNYIVEESLGLNPETNLFEYTLRCETLGAAPNTVTGDLSAINEIPTGLEIARITACLIEGEDSATDDEIIRTYVEFVTSAVSDGNVAQYERWCSEYEGVGNYKIFPLWNGANTVKVSILTASNRAIDTNEDGNLVDVFQEYLDPNTEGMGNGKAPIGAFVTVTTATEVPINVSGKVTLSSGYSQLDMPDIEGAITKFFANIAYKKKVVSYMSLGAAILDVPGVEFVAELTLNDGSQDIILDAEQIPALGTTTWAVV